MYSLFWDLLRRGSRPKSLEKGSLNGNNHSSVPYTHQKPEVAFHLEEGITLLFSRWHGLQMAVQNQWGGHDSFQKSQQLAADIFSWLFQSKALQIEDLENLLHESMLLSLNTDIEDGSIEEVAEQLMIMHEEYLHGNSLDKKEEI